LKIPPHGYDDHTVIAKGRLLLLLDRFEGNIRKVEKVATNRFFPDEMEQDFVQFRHTASELESRYQEAVEKLIKISSDYIQNPTEECRQDLQKEINQLKGLL
jgi:hypothetical protein